MDSVLSPRMDKKFFNASSRGGDVKHADHILKKMSIEGICFSLSLLVTTLFCLMCLLCGLLRCPSVIASRYVRTTPSAQLNEETTKQVEPPPPYPGRSDEYRVEEDPPPPYPGLVNSEVSSRQDL